MSDKTTTAIHEAGHAVAFYRLFHDSWRNGGLLTIEPRKHVLGAHSAEELAFEGNSELTEDQQKAFENEAIYACAGYAAVLAAGYSDAEAVAGCESDFDLASYYCDIALDETKDRAKLLMAKPENIEAVARLADELIERSVLDDDEVFFIIAIADGEATELDLHRYREAKA